MNEFFTKISELSALFADMKALANSTNNLPFSLYWANKIVEIDTHNKKVYRAETPAEVYKRILIQRFFSKKGLEVFAQETLKKEFSSEFVSVTSQKMLTLWQGSPKELQAKLEQDLGTKEYEKLTDLFNKFQIGWYDVNNAGIDSNGKIKIFDYIANLALIYDLDGRPSLINAEGEVLIKYVE